MKKFIGAILGLLIIINVAHAKNNELGKHAENFIISLSSQVAELNQNRSLDNTTRQQKFMKLVERGFDLPWIAKFVVGRPWKTASPDQQKEYLSLY